jgi:hypothetical protein
LPEDGAPEDELVGAKEGPLLEEIEGMMEDDRIPPDLLEELGLSRDELRELIEGLRRAQEDAEEEDVGEEPEPGETDEEAGVLSGGKAGGGMRLVDGLPADVTPDDLRSRFEGARERLSDRYRDIVDQYYKALSEER